MTSVLVSDQYMVMIAITLFFTVFALTRRSVTLDALAAFCWFAMAAAHLIVGDLTSPLTTTLPWLYFGIGLLFFVVFIRDVISIFAELERRKWEELP